MPFPVARNVGFSNTVRLRTHHGRITTRQAIPMTNTVSQRLPAAVLREKRSGMPNSGTRKTASGRVNAANPMMTPSQSASSTSASAQSRYANEQRDRDHEHVHRLRDEHPVVDPELRVHRGDARGDQAGPVTRDLAPDEAHGDDRGRRRAGTTPTGAPAPR